MSTVNLSVDIVQDGVNKGVLGANTVLHIMCHIFMFLTVYSNSSVRGYPHCVF